MIILLLIQYSTKLEQMYEGRTSEYLWVILFGAVSIFLLDFVLQLNFPFFATPLIFYVLYIWCRRHPTAQNSVFGLFNISAAYLPFFLMLMSTLMGGSIVTMLLGIFVGHVFHFFNDLHPMTQGAWIFKPPRFLRDLVRDETTAQTAAAGGAYVGGHGCGL